MVDTFDKPWSGIGVGGSMAMDFANTLDWRLREKPEEQFGSFEELLRWGWSSGALEPAGARALREWGKSHPILASRALVRAIDVREAMAAVFFAVFHRRKIPADALARLDAACRSAGAARALLPEGAGAAWGWRDDSPSPDRVTWAVALDAARILTSSERERIRQCGDFECGWFFLDTSKNRTRRWCTMKSCGNRNKARSYYRRSVVRG